MHGCPKGLSMPQACPPPHDRQLHKYLEVLDMELWFGLCWRAPEIDQTGRFGMFRKVVVTAVFASMSMALVGHAEPCLPENTTPVAGVSATVDAAAKALAETPPPGVSDADVKRIAAALQKDAALLNRLAGAGVPWKELMTGVEPLLPEGIRNSQTSVRTVYFVLNEMLGVNKWTTEKRPKANGAPGTASWAKIGTPDPNQGKAAKDIAASLKKDAAFMTRLSDRGIPWMGVQVKIEPLLPKESQGKDAAFSALPDVMSALVGYGKWSTEKRPKANGAPGTTTWVVVN